MKVETLTAPHGRELTPAERQILLRRLKHGPALDRAALAEYAVRLQREVIAARNQESA